MSNRQGDYVVINDWMCDGLKLKGPRLIAYAVIYGFTKKGMGLFVGSVPYLMKWTGCSKRTVYRILDELVAEGFVEKSEIAENGSAKTCFKAVEIQCQNGTNECQNDKIECQNGTTQCQNGTTFCQNDTPIYSNNLINNLVDNLTDNNIVEIVDYLNSVLGTRYRPNSSATSKHIKARLNNGFTVDDFKVVIDKKAAAWKGDPKMAKYLRPETLFGPKFEGYLNEISPSKAKSREEELNDRFAKFY